MCRISNFERKVCNQMYFCQKKDCHCRIFDRSHFVGSYLGSPCTCEHAVASIGTPTTRPQKVSWGNPQSLVLQLANRWSKQPPEGPLTEDPSTQESHPDHGRVFFTIEATIKNKQFRRRVHLVEKHMFLATADDGQNTHPESAFGRILIGWAFGRSLKIAPFIVRRFVSQGFPVVPLSTNSQFGSRELNLQLPFSVRKDFTLSALLTRFSVRTRFFLHSDCNRFNSDRNDLRVRWEPPCFPLFGAADIGISEHSCFGVIWGKIVGFLFWWSCLPINKHQWLLPLKPIFFAVILFWPHVQSWIRCGGGSLLGDNRFSCWSGLQRGLAFVQ